MNYTSRDFKGFTIVELLIVIVVIGAMVAIAILSYAGVSQRAIAISLKSDLRNAATQLEIDKLNNSENYPSSILAANNGLGLLKSSDTQYIYNYQNSNSYCLSATSVSSSTISYYISSDNKSIESGKCPTLWKDISASPASTCGVTDDGIVYCWGNNSSGKLGDNTLVTPRLIPTTIYTTGLPSGDEIYSSISSRSGSFACAITSNQKPYCWENNTYGQVGNSTTTTPYLSPTATSTSYSFTSISTGWYHTCGTISSNDLYCWGYNMNGQLGYGVRGIGTDRSTPTLVSTTNLDTGCKAFNTVSSGHDITCGISTNNKAFCWGYNSAGQAGNGTSNTYQNAPYPVTVSGMPSYDQTFISIAADSQSATCGITTSNNVYCWGNGSSGSVGDNTGSVRLVPASIYTTGLPSGDDKYKAISVGGEDVCAISSNDTLYCWGRNSSGQLGNGGTDNKLSPTAVDVSALPASHQKFKAIAVEQDHACAITTTGRLYCWGDNTYGQFGNNSTSSSYVPVLVPSL